MRYIVIILIAALISSCERENHTEEKTMEMVNPPLRAPSDSTSAIIPDTTTTSEKGMFTVHLKVTTPGENPRGALINVTKGGTLISTFHSDGTERPVSLDLNSDYVIECSKPGFITKAVYFNTHVPRGRETEEFARFTAEVELHKEMNRKESGSRKPVGEVKYDPALEDFDKVKK